jgi:hypothetical protein
MKIPTENFVPRKMPRVTVSLTKQAYGMLQAMQQCGLFGLTKSSVIERVFSQYLIENAEKLERFGVKVPVYRPKRRGQ